MIFLEDDDEVLRAESVDSSEMAEESESVRGTVASLSSAKDPIADSMEPEESASDRDVATVEMGAPWVFSKRATAAGENMMMVLVHSNPRAVATLTLLYCTKITILITIPILLRIYLNIQLFVRFMYLRQSHIN